MLTVLSSSDAPWLSALHAVCFSAPWSTDAFVGALVQPAVCGWSIERQGFALWQQVCDDVEVLTLAVAPQARRQGIARRLMEHACRLPQGRPARVFLEVATDNAAALALYDRLGFLRMGLRPAYYARGLTTQDAVTMQKLLD